jgi:outer membrane protein assembly factor BamB
MRRCLWLALPVVISTVATCASADDWPGFRGGQGGVAPDRDLPTQVTKDNILWKVKLPGVGASSPIVAGDKVYVTAYTGYGTAITKGFGGGKGGFGKGGFGKGAAADPEQKKLKFLLVCLDRAKGVIAWQKEIEPKLPEVAFSGMIREHGYATSTPTADEERVYAFFGKSGVLAFDHSGTELWRADVGSGTHFMGTGASPVLYKDLLIVDAAIESHALVALDKKTGKEVWRAKGLGTSWASPVLVQTPAGKTEVVVSSPGKIVGYDPESGQELWHCVGIGRGGTYDGTSSSPVARDGVVYVMGGGGPTPAATVAVKTGGSGDVTKTHVLWRQRVGGSYCSPVLVGDYLCWVDGTLQCLNVADGTAAFKNRLYDGRGEYVSAVAAGSTLFALPRTSGSTVLPSLRSWHTTNLKATTASSTPAPRSVTAGFISAPTPSCIALARSRELVRG